MKIPNELAKTVGSPQKIVRQIKLGDLDVMIRLQKPFEEPEDGKVNISLRIDTKGNISEVPDESYIEFGTAIVVEAWSDVTNSVVTQGIRKSDGQTEAQFAFGAQYMMNNGTDKQWLEVLQARRIDKVLTLACCNKPIKFAEPTVKQKKKKK
jgi:hypothetical protein